MILTEVERQILENHSAIMAALIQRETEPSIKGELLKAYAATGEMLKASSRRTG